mmetsp:Transcript_17012/g.28417  ORF Transcript_17012/g.28417 Transcript_17012/m.28417 type:complete len:485 (-) Transcript_17012:272-1726(-)|eukprot:CAMPEP_0119302844 /NCGR_PEP_ID=MMETSP1333-20130426/4371_1 /TAXON_ID=418940 /ORGANISM="Scyphosphaera apsteinii, Strain RCC1455" /LENGTH=484 /DNA_ID=CAMNT_0007305323 /DNA_START=52 /DNA_END=1506 /DNA_ORIENTATION=+
MEQYPGTYPGYYPKGLGKAIAVHGSCATGWESVRDVFAQSFTERLEGGAALCVYYKGERVVDLWGGERYLGIPWEKDTIVNSFSLSKGLCALGLALLHSKRLLDYDEKVATYWPEFGCNGKGGITVREMLSHSVGICVLDTAITLDMIADHKKLGQAIASTKMHWGPEAKKNGYMGQTLGWYEDQLCRRIDPRKRSIVDFVKEEIATKVGVEDEFFIGLPPPNVLPRSRVAALNAWGPFDLFFRGKFPSAFVNNFLFKPSSYAARALSICPKLGDTRVYGTEEVRKLVCPASNGHTSARAVAAVYNTFLSDLRPGSSSLRVGFTQETADELRTPALVQFDEVIQANTCFSHGWVRPSPLYVFGSSDIAFGCPGFGGNFGFCDPDADLAFGFVTNGMGLYLSIDPRELAIRQEIYQTVRRLGGASREQLPDPDLAKRMAAGTEKETLRIDPLLNVLSLIFKASRTLVKPALIISLSFAILQFYNT